MVKVLDKAFRELKAIALSYPETGEDHPWGETAIKVKSKAFVFMACEEGALRLSMKLSVRLEFALQYPFASPTGYGLGKSGWVTAAFRSKDKPPMDVLAAWIDESYRNVAPKKIVALLGKPAAPARGRRRTTAA